MKASSILTPQLAFWGICLIAMAWIAATILFELYLGWPVTGVQWLKRIVGWAVEFWLIRTLIVRTRHHAGGAPK